MSNRASEVRPDRFWVVMTGVPLVLYALLGTLAIVFATAK